MPSVDEQAMEVDSSISPAVSPNDVKPMDISSPQETTSSTTGASNTGVSTTALISSQGHGSQQPARLASNAPPQNAGESTPVSTAGVTGLHTSGNPALGRWWKGGAGGWRGELWIWYLLCNSMKYKWKLIRTKISWENRGESFGKLVAWLGCG